MLDVRRIVELHRQLVIDWHASPPPPGGWQAAGRDAPGTVYDQIAAQHQYNFQLWHEEDQARCPQASDRQIAGVKRNIDRLNQQRNDGMEIIDEWIEDQLTAQRVVPLAGARLHSETPGSIIDRLSILALRIYHLAEQRDQAAATPPLRGELAQKLAVGQLQRDDLASALAELLEDLRAGRKRHRTFRQMKMYNDRRLNPYLAAAARSA